MQHNSVVGEGGAGWMMMMLMMMMMITFKNFFTKEFSYQNTNACKSAAHL
jgi:hypothetical protein